MKIITEISRLHSYTRRVNDFRELFHTVQLLLILLCCLLLSSVEAAPSSPRIVIIIDDIGYHKADIKLIELPYALTFAVLPHTPYGQRYAQFAFQQDKDVMLHMPMEASNGKALGPVALTRDMNKEQVHQTLQTALADVPYAIGVNNHMGSLYTALEQPMAWTMEYLKQRQLFFVDSLTTADSTAEKYASQFAVTHLSRQVFLDNDLTEAALQRQFNQLIRIAQQNRQAIAIAHPYPETYQFLKKTLPQLSKYGVELVGISSLLPKEHEIIAAGFTAPAGAANK